MRIYQPLQGDLAILREGTAFLAAERLGLLAPPDSYLFEHERTWRQCNWAGGECAYHYAGRGGYRRDCDRVITMYKVRLDLGLTELRGSAYAYAPAHELDAASDPIDSAALTGWHEYDLWVHTGGDRHVTRLARRLHPGNRITMAYRASFNGRVPASILGFTKVTERSGHFVRPHPSRDPWW